MGGWFQGHALEGWRRSRRPLQSGRWRRRGVQWRGPDVLAVATHLGLRNARRLIRAVCARARPSADGATETPYLGRVRLLHADIGDDLSDVLWSQATHSEARSQRPDLGGQRRVGIF